MPAFTWICRLNMSQPIIGKIFIEIAFVFPLCVIGSIFMDRFDGNNRISPVKKWQLAGHFILYRCFIDKIISQPFTKLRCFWPYSATIGSTLRPRLQLQVALELPRCFSESEKTTSESSLLSAASSGLIILQWCDRLKLFYLIYYISLIFNNAMECTARIVGILTCVWASTFWPIPKVAGCIFFIQKWRFYCRFLNRW